MNRKRMSWLLVLVFVGSLLSIVPLRAAPPWEKLLTFNRVEADANKSYRLSKDDGPWVIMACSFSGEGAEEQAKQLVLELRKKYKLSAFWHKMTFSIEAGTDVRQVDRFGTPRKLRYAKEGQLQETAVLVGNYISIDDQDAQDDLNTLKYAKPDCLELKEGKKTNQSLAQFRWLIQRKWLSEDSKKRKKGSMRHAFVTTNPLLPKEYFVSKGVDKLVLQMNEGVKHSLLDCPGKYTVQVAHFSGSSIINKTKKKESKGTKSLLVEAAENAHMLTEALRIKGWEAYEFHDRTSSVVTVGHFESVGTKLQNGRFQTNPKIQKIVGTFKATTNPNSRNLSCPYTPKVVVGIPCDLEPMPVCVPKRSISSAYQGKSRF